MSTLMERTRPKGFNRKVWTALFAEAEKEKSWALTTLLDPEWAANASQCSIEYLGRCLCEKPWALAADSYRYLEMRAHGQTCFGALDPTARERWETLSGKKIGPRSTWRYDHTVHITSARKHGRKWVDYNGKAIKIA